MAIVNVLQTMTFLDADGNRASMPVYFTFDDATATLAQVRQFAQENADLVEAISDAQLIATSMSLELSLPGGIKSAPVAGSNVQETGLNTFNLVSPAGKAYAYDIPAIAQTVLSGKEINQSNAGWQAWRDRWLLGGTGIIRNNLWSTALLSVRTAVKSFRKSGS